MAGLEYRGTLTGTIPTPAKDYPCDATYWATVKPGDAVNFNASGNVIKAPITGPASGVLIAKEFIMEKEAPIVKVRTDKSALYEAKVAAGTPVRFGEYELTATGEVDASKNTNKAVRVHQIYPEGTVLVSLL